MCDVALLIILIQDFKDTIIYTCLSPNNTDTRGKKENERKKVEGRSV
jgi:hypothetical protein